MLRRYYCIQMVLPHSVADTFSHIHETLFPFPARNHDTRKEECGSDTFYWKGNQILARTREMKREKQTCYRVWYIK